MVGLGTIVNVSAIVVGGGLGLLVRGGLGERRQQAVIQALGLCTMFIGLSGALPGLLVVEGNTLASVAMKETLGMILALAFGTLIGEWLDLEGWLERLGVWLKAGPTGAGETADLSKALSPPPSPCASGPWPSWAPSRTGCPATPLPSLPNPFWISSLL